VRFPSSGQAVSKSPELRLRRTGIFNFIKDQALVLEGEASIADIQ